VVRLTSRALAGTFEDPADAARAIEGLREAHVEPDQVSVLLRSEPPPAEPGGRERETATRSRGLGALAPAVHWLGGLVSAEAAGLGRVVGAGAALDALAGGAQGSLVGALEGLGLPLWGARSYQEQVRQGRVLVVVAVPDRTVAEQTRRVLADYGAVETFYFTGRLYGTAYHGAGPGA